jgi:cellulose synthase/poly-beta-1,6-N-acetylglucosamine synthase-like glycosyltransferase
MPSISYAITACNEHVELERLLDQLNEHIRPEDEIMLQLDHNATKEVLNVANKYNIGSPYEYYRIWFPLNNDFGAFKSHLKKICTRDYIFFIDADEYLSDTLILNLPEILEANPTIDIFAVPRVNTVDGLTPEHIQKWRWRVDEKGWVNYPDYQTRICKNRPDIDWKGKVHERLTTDKPCMVEMIPANHDLDLFHPKDIARQERQNNYYDTI